MTIERLALAAGVFLLATGGFFGTVVDGRLSEMVPSAAATAILLILLLRRSRLHLPAATLPLLILLVLTSRSPLHAPEILSLAAATVAFLAGANASEDDLARRALMAAGVLLIGYGFYQKFVLFPQLLPMLQGDAWNRVRSGRVFSAFILPAQYAAYCAILLQPSLVGAMIGRRKILFRAAMTPLILLGMLSSGAVSGFIAAAAGAAHLFGSPRRWLAIAILAVVGIAITTLWRPEILEFGSTSNPVTLRIATWKSTVRGIADAPMIGHGTGSFEHRFMQYWMPGADEVRHPHSWPLKIAFEQGLLGLACWLWFAAFLFSPARDRSWRAAAIAFFAATLFDVADHSMTLRALGLFAFSASLVRPEERSGALPA